KVVFFKQKTAYEIAGRNPVFPLIPSMLNPLFPRGAAAREKIRVYPVLTLVLTVDVLRAFSSLGCPDFTLDQTLALAAKHGIGAVELRALGGTVELPAYFIQHFGTPAALAAGVRGSGVQVVAFDASLHLVGA